MFLREILELSEELNVNGFDYPFFGVNKEKEFMPTAATTEGLNKKKYKIIRKDKFVYSGMQTGRDVCIRFALYSHTEPLLLSPAYTILKVSKENVLPDYVFLNFLSFEKDRLGWFYSDGSVRANLDLPRFLDIDIPVPSLETQRKYADAYNALRKLAEQNEAMIRPLLEFCTAIVSKFMNKNISVELNDFIEPIDERNTNLEISLSQGISNEKLFTNPKQTAVNSKSDKIVRKGNFAYNRATTRNGDKISIAYRTGEDCTVSSAYQVFRIKEEKKLNPLYLLLWFMRPEFDRYARYVSKGSAHEFFEYDEMCRVKIPLPPIEVQESIVAIYKCAEKARSIAERAREEMKRICPAMIQRAAHQ